MPLAPSPAAPSAPTRSSASGEPVVVFDRVSRHFGEFRALNELSLRVERGDIYGLLGLNGAGKTTSIRILLGLLANDSGRVEIFGRSAPRDRRIALARVGAMIEGPAFYPHLGGLENLRLLHGLNATPGGRSPEEALELVGLNRAARVRARKYSMGMLQRLYLAQALLGRPELLVLDEPTSNLDPQGILEVREVIRRLAREHGTTIILSSHQLSEVEGMCDRVGIVNRGRMLLESSVSDLFATEECDVTIQLDRPEEGLAALRELGWAESPTLDAEGTLSARIARPRRGELNALLVGRGFVVSEFRERRPTLEDYFHRRIAEDAA